MFLRLFLVVLSITLIAAPLWAANCWVPSNDYPTIQLAVNDLTCSEIILAEGFHHGEVVIDRSLSMTGDSQDTTAIVGTLTVQGETTEVAFNDFHIEVPEPGLPFNGLVVVGSAKVITSGGTLFVGVTDFLFVDGFESGDTSRWSATTP